MNMKSVKVNVCHTAVDKICVKYTLGISRPVRRIVFSRVYYDGVENIEVFTNRIRAKVCFGSNEAD